LITWIFDRHVVEFDDNTKAIPNTKGRVVEGTKTIKELINKMLDDNSDLSASERTRLKRDIYKSL